MTGSRPPSPPASPSVSLTHPSPPPSPPRRSSRIKRLLNKLNSNNSVINQSVSSTIDVCGSSGGNTNSISTPPIIPIPPIAISLPSSSNKNHIDNSTQQTIKDFINIHTEAINKEGVLPPLHQIPSASIVTYNPSSLSRYSNNQNHVNNTLAKFAKKYDIIFLQETKLLALESKALKGILSNHEVTFSNNPSNTGAKASTYTAGVCTAISKKISKDYTLKTIALPPSLLGHCLVTLISLPGTDFSLKLINIRLLTPELDKLGVQEQMIGDLRGALSLHPSKYTIMGGDFNFVERGEDTTSVFKVESRPQWELFRRSTPLSTVPTISTPSFTKPGRTTPGPLALSGRGLLASTGSTSLTPKLISLWLSLWL